MARKKSEKSQMMLDRIAEMRGKGYVTATEAAIILGIGQRSLPALVARTRITVLRVTPRSVFYRRADLAWLLQSRAQKHAAQAARARASAKRVVRIGASVAR